MELYALVLYIIFRLVKLHVILRTTLQNSYIQTWFKTYSPTTRLLHDREGIEGERILASSLPLDLAARSFVRADERLLVAHVQRAPPIIRERPRRCR